MAVREYLEVSKPRIVVVLVIVAVTSMLAASRFDNTPEVGWDISMWNLLFLVISGTLASAGSSALNHYYDRDIDKVMPTNIKKTDSFRQVASAEGAIFRASPLCGFGLYRGFDIKFGVSRHDRFRDIHLCGCIHNLAQEE